MLFRLFCLSFVVVICGCAREPQQTEKSPSPAPSVESEPVGGIVTWGVPVEWIEEPVTPGGPIATFRLPRYDDEEPEDGRAWVYHFGKKSSRVDSLTNHVYEEFIPPDGRSARDAARQFGGVFNNVSHRFVEIDGTYVPAEGPQKPGYRLLSATVLTKSGPYFVKVIGPERTIDYYKSDFYNFMSSFEEASP